jgi:tripartite-type tricarboxylate transporter receptor subunit TctC
MHRSSPRVTSSQEDVLAILVRSFVCCILIALAAPAFAQPWPSRPIKLVVPTGPGAATDVMARLLSDGISRALGQPVVVENQAGASGIVAHQAVARAAPDGYTLLFTNTSGMIYNTLSFKTLPYDPERDFTPVASVCSQGPQMLSVNADVPVHSVPELIDYAKANRGKYSIAYDTTAGAAGVATRLFNKRADAGLIEVPYRSAAQMAQDAASGVNPVLMSSIAAANAVVQAGKVRRLAVTSAKRFQGLPDLPALNETLPGVVVVGWFGVVVPTGTPAAIVSRLNHEIGEFLKNPEIQQRLITFGLATNGAGTPDSTAALIREMREHWRALARELDIQPQ